MLAIALDYQAIYIQGVDIGTFLIWQLSVSLDNRLLLHQEAVQCIGKP